jgi:hypothetical protein
VLDEQALQFHEMSLDDDCPVAERLQSPPRRINSLWIAINAEDFAVRITGIKDVKGVPTITHGAVQVDTLTTGPEPEEDFCGHNRDVLSVAAKLTSTNFTHILPRHRGVYSSLLHCQQYFQGLMDIVSNTDQRTMHTA